MTNLKFTIIYDTYCGWCYGAAPVLDALVSSGATVQLLHRQLFVGANAHKIADGFGAQAIRMDAQIEKLTGQEFSKTYMDNILRSKDEILNSELTAQAAVLIRDKGPQAELSLAARLQKQRFVDGVSAADRAAVIAALIAEGVSAQAADQLGSAEIRLKADETAHQAAQVMMQHGGRGVPTVLCSGRDGTEIIDISRYYGNPNKVLKLAA